jgi:SAM-dependent methyltransferase
MTSQVEARSAGTYSTTDIGSRRLDRVSVVESAFDTWQPRGGDRVDLVFATTAWHWLDPAVRYEQAWRLLRPGGHLPRYVERRHVFPGDGDPFFVELEEVYDEMAVGPPHDAVRSRSGELSDYSEEIEGTGLFTDVVVSHFDGN